MVRGPDPVSSDQGNRPVSRRRKKRPEAVVVPEQDLEFVASAVAKYEQAGTKGIQFKAVSHQSGQAIHRLARVGGAAGQVNLPVIPGGQYA